MNRYALKAQGKRGQKKGMMNIERCRQKRKREKEMVKIDIATKRVALNKSLNKQKLLNHLCTTRTTLI